MTLPLPTVLAPLALSKMRELAESKLVVIHEDLSAVLTELGLKAYANPMDPNHYWLGMPDTRVPEHDRWFFAVNVRRASHTDLIPYYNVLNCGTAVLEEDDGWESSKDLMDTLWSLRDEINDALQDAAGEWAAREDEFVRKCMLMFQAFSYLGIDFSNELLPLAWDRDLHDLLHHHDTWCGYHPEAEGMPRDLVLRMHGLKDYAGHLAGGLDWLKLYEPGTAIIQLTV